MGAAARRSAALRYADGSAQRTATTSERALNPPQLWASNFPQFCRGG
jgi:hypothetical protein